MRVPELQGGERRRTRRRAGRVTATLFAALLGPLAAPSLTQSIDPVTTALVKAVREALGGPRLDSVRSLLLEGDQTSFANIPGYGDVELPGALEMRLVPPDSYLTILRARDVDSVSGMGLHRNALVELGGAVYISPKDITAAIRESHRRRMRRDATRMLAALLLSDRTPVPIRFAYGGRAQSPEGPAEVLDVVWGEDLPVRLFVDAGSKLPLMMTFSELDFKKGAAPADRSQLRFTMPEFEKVAKAWYFSDYRDEKGIKVPHALVRTSAGATELQWHIKTVKINPPDILDAFGR